MTPSEKTFWIRSCIYQYTNYIVGKYFWQLDFVENLKKRLLHKKAPYKIMFKSTDLIGCESK